MQSPSLLRGRQAFNHSAHAPRTRVSASVNTPQQPGPSGTSRPSGGCSRAGDLPIQNDVSGSTIRTPFPSRPSMGASRGVYLSPASTSAASPDRPGGRGRFGDLPSSDDTGMVAA